MNEITISLIIVTPIYFFILSIFTIMLIRDLKRGKVENLVAGVLILFDTKKYKIDNRNIVTMSKDKFPKEYWIGIVLRSFFVLFTLLVGFILYKKIIGL